MKCPNCGNEISKKEKFCGNCGYKISQNNNKSKNLNEIQTESYIDKSIDQVTTSNVFGNITPLLIFIIIVVVVLLLPTAIETFTFFSILAILIIVSIFIRSKQKANNFEKSENFKKQKKQLLLNLKNNNFNTSYVMLTLDNRGILIDEKNKKLAISTNDSLSPIIYNFDDIMSYELIEDGNQEIQGKGFETLAAGKFFGPNAALATASSSKTVNQYCTSLYVIIHIKGIENENSKIILIESRLNKTDSWYRALYDFGKNIVITLDKIININKEESKQKSYTKEISEENSAVDNIKKLKELLDMDAITKEEYEEKKKELLNKM